MKIILKALNFRPQQAPSGNARSNTCYFMSRKRRIAKGLNVGKKSIRGAAHRSGHKES